MIFSYQANVIPDAQIAATLSFQAFAGTAGQTVLTPSLIVNTNTVFTPSVSGGTPAVPGRQTLSGMGMGAVGKLMERP